MKKILSILVGLAICTFSFAQVMAFSNTAPKKYLDPFPRNSLPDFYSLMEQFKDEVEDWNVGNLHVYGHAPQQPMSEYKYAGEKSDNKFHELLPWRFQNRVIRGYDIFPVAELRGANDEKDLFIVRSGKGDITDGLFLFSSNDGKLKKPIELSYYKKKGNTWQQLDSWIKDVDRDGRLDLVQKKQITDRWGHILGTKTKVFLMTPKGKFKKSKKFTLDDGDFPLKDLRK